MATLTKKDIATHVSDRMGFSRRVCLLLVDRIFRHVRDALLTGAEVKIVRFGTFSPVLKRERRGVSPVTGAPIVIPARKTVVFRPSRILKDCLHGKASEEILQDRGGQQTDRG
ncbi:MAG: HU family DNA-binding protein [Deltaproteobacteria bacterium]